MTIISAVSTGCMVIPFAGGQPERIIDIVQGLGPSAFIRWFPDGEALTYAAARNDVSNVWMQPIIYMSSIPSCLTPEVESCLKAAPPCV